MKESDFSKKFIEHMNTKFPLAWSAKIHIDEMQSNSIPDYLLCINGVFLAIEFKVQRDSRISITPGQMKELNKIKNANGVALIIAFDEDNKKLLLRSTRLDYKEIFFSHANTKAIKSKNIKIDWDFAFNKYEDIVDVIKIMVEST